MRRTIKEERNEYGFALVIFLEISSTARISVLTKLVFYFIFLSYSGHIQEKIFIGLNRHEWMYEANRSKKKGWIQIRDDDIFTFTVVKRMVPFDLIPIWDWVFSVNKKKAAHDII